MILKNLSVSVLIVFLLGTLSYGDTAPVEVSTPVSELKPSIPALSLDALVPSDSSPQGGMDPVVRRIYLSMVTPSKQPVMAPNWGFWVSSVESYTVNDEGIKPISCSFIARRNLGALLDVFGIFAPSIFQGDANDLIRFWRVNNTLTSFSDKKAFLDALDQRRKEHFETVFDVYRHVATRSYAYQGHRVTVFLGNDDRWYILDPLDGEKVTAPQALETYLQNDVEAEWLVRFPGFSHFNVLEPERFPTILPFLGSDIQLLFQEELLWYRNMGTTLTQTESTSSESQTV